MQGALTHSGKSSQPFSTPENSHPQWSIEAVLGSLLSSCFGEREIILQRLIQHLPCCGFSGVRTYWSEFCRTSSLHINLSFEPGNAECRKSGILSMDSTALIKSPYPNDPQTCDTSSQPMIRSLGLSSLSSQHREATEPCLSCSTIVSQIWYLCRLNTLILIEFLSSLT